MILPWALLWLFIQLSSSHSEKENSLLIKIIQETVTAISKDVKIPEDFGLNIFDFLNKYGYPFESYNVTTEDGYILNLHRIPHGRNNSERSVNNTKPAVLLQHGLLCSSIGWINLGPGKSVALMLADAGYDVWLGNNRGNTYSRQHESLDPDNDTEFWDFSFHEFGYYDVPAFIDHILNITGNDQLYYVGHSQGTSQFFAMASSRPEYNDKVAHMTALAPIAYLHKQRSILPQFLADNLSLIQLLLRELGINNIFPPNQMKSQWGIILCGDGSPFQEICAQLIFFIAGEDSPQLNRTWIPVLLSSLPDDTSIKTFAHLLQLIRDDSFKQYDYGIQGNMKRYGTPSAPPYDLFEAKVPIAIYFAENDLFNTRRMEEPDVDLTTTLRSEIAALQYKRNRLQSELEDMRSQVRTRDQRCLDLQVEADQLREQTARQTAIISSLKKRVHELEERERNLLATQGRHEIALQTAIRDMRYNEEKVKELEAKVRNLEIDLSHEEQKKESARLNLQDFVRRLSVALGADLMDCSHVSPESLVHKAAELVQETTRIRNKANNLGDNLGACDLELRTCREELERAVADKECLQRQSAAQGVEIDRLRQEKDSLESQQRLTERELLEIKEKLAISNRSLGSATANIAQQESIICQMRDELKMKEEKIQRLHAEHKQTMESLAISLSTPVRYVESLECHIKDRIHEIVTENKDKSAQIEALREKLSHEDQQLVRHASMYEQAAVRIRALEDEKSHLDARLHKAEAEIRACELSRDGLMRDKTTFVSFLERLARALNMDELSHDIGVDLHTESLLHRAEQLARLESEKLVDKTAMVYQLQRRVRTLREQVQRKDLHLDLLRRKLALQDDNAKAKALLQNERDEANLRFKKLVKQVDRLQIQLSEAKSQIRELTCQLTEAADYKITALERGRKIEELQKRLIESETIRTKYNRKVTLLKDQVRATGDTIEQERSISEHSIQLLRDELARIKDTLSEVQRREAQLQNFKHSVAKILGAAIPIPDFELISRLQKLVDAHHDYTLVSRRYDDPVLRLTARSPTGGSRCTRTPDRSRYDDSGYNDAVDLDDTDDDIFKRHPRPM